MPTTYPVVWQEADGARRSGRAELGPQGLTLEGSNGDAAASRTVDYAQVTDVHLARSNGDRLQGHPTVVLELASGDAVRIAGVGQPGVASELADRLADLAARARPRQLAALVVPLVPGAKEQAEVLLRNGPPFEPGELGLTRHEVFLTEECVVFVFEGAPSAFVRRLADDPSIWEAAEAWRPLVSGRIRFADAQYAWPT